ncbi:MAG TPA: TRAP transporter substrate-binding protein [Gammaproteobacteria bacterium]|nr:TRAP transporter substrate-binding protein [Gammaproteobacteria bacterium]
MKWIAFLLIIAVCGCADNNKEPSTFAIATATTGGLYYPFGGSMASIWSNQLEGINAKAEVTGGSVINVIQVSRHESEIGIAMGDVVTDAYLGQGNFSQPLPLRVLFTAYPNIVHIMALEGNGIQGLADLVGKRVSLGAAGSGTAAAAENIISGVGMSLDDLALNYLGFGETTTALKDGVIDAGFIFGGLGVAAVAELAVTRNLRLIPLSESELSAIVEKFPAYRGYDIPAGTYDKIEHDVHTLGVWTVVVVHSDMAENTAYQLTCTIYREREQLIKVTQAAKDTTLENIHQLKAVPLHPGTLRYLANPDAPCVDDPAA